MHTVIEEQKKEILEAYGYKESMLELENME